MELIVLLGAESDIQVAFNRFEEYREGVGLQFLQELELAYEYLRTAKGDRSNVGGSPFPICCLSCSPTRVHLFQRRKAFHTAFPVFPEGLLRAQRP